MHNLIIPLVTCVIAFAAIFGYQAYTDSQLDEHIERAIATSLAGERPGEIEVELTATHAVNKGYGVCGTYTLASPEDDSDAFFYSKVSEHVTLGVDARDYRANCDAR
ncbi:hypothetical protein [Modicisalibacter radicis]|uniref:hypothetical protein n=1 Tax=Halomonas sp. EAR18 TaxID=2518972 RepID=UPI00109C0103|nr:hypothetical protein [Halomonas sp. EAR18]